MDSNTWCQSPITTSSDFEQIERGIQQGQRERAVAFSSMLSRFFWRAQGQAHK